MSKSKVLSTSKIEELRKKISELEKSESELEKSRETFEHALADSRRRQVEINALLECNKSILRHQSFEETLRSIFTSCRNLIGVENGYISFLSEDQTEEQEMYLDTGQGLMAPSGPSRLSENKLQRIAIESGESLIENDYASSEWAKTLPSQHIKISNILFSPLKINEKSIGIICLINKPGGFDENDLRLSSAFSEFAAIAAINSKTIDSLEKSEERFRSVAESAKEIIITADLEGKIIQLNRSACDNFWYTADEIIGKNVEILIPELMENAHFLGIIEPDSSEDSWQIESNFEIQGFRKNGSGFPIDLSISIWKTSEGKFLSVIGRDITERRQMEEELLKIAKLESLGVLAGGIAHDFNNVLMAIIANISLAKMHIPSGGRVYDLLLDMERAAMGAKSLTQQMLTFSKGGAPLKKVVSIIELLKVTADFVLRGSNIKCSYNIQPNLLDVNIDVEQINQVISNLVINAKQAMSKGGTIEIEALNIIVGKSGEESGETRLERFLKPGRYVKISVKDNGSGIREEELNKVFDPFYSSKRGGSGLGLSSSFSIMRKHDGYIDVESVVGEGADFHFYLPAVTAESDSGKETPDRQECAGRILIMDDRLMILDTVSELLQGFGYEVEISQNGSEAVEKYSKAMDSGNPYDAVIMDLIVPGEMGGLEATRNILKIHPEARIIVSSGYSTDPIMANYKEHGFINMLPKPYSIAEMDEVLKQAIGKDSGND